MLNYLVFSVDNQQFGVTLDAVKRVIWAVSVTPIHESSKNLLGIVNVHGEVIPVLNIRYTLGLNDKDIDLSDQFIICSFPSGKVALWVDKVLEISSLEGNEVAAGNSSVFGGRGVSSVLKCGSKLVAVYDWEIFLDEVVKPGVEA